MNMWQTNKYTPKLLIAPDKDGKIRRIEDVPSGIACGCFCPECHQPLVARLKRKEKGHQSHFAHAKGNSDCPGAVENAIHLLAKEVLAECKSLCMPKQWVNARTHFDFDKVEVEKTDNSTNLRPDCIGYYEDREMWIEFKNTHAVDDTKADKIKERKIDCVEIDLKDCSQDKEKMKVFLCYSKENREWIYDVEREKYRILMREETRRRREEEIRRKKEEQRKFYEQIQKEIEEDIKKEVERWKRENENKKRVQSERKEINQLEQPPTESSYAHLTDVKESSFEDYDNGLAFRIGRQMSNILSDYESHFNSSEEFVILIQQKLTCNGKDCQRISGGHVCSKIENKRYNLKISGGYNKCERNLKIGNLLVISNGKPNNEIAICGDERKDAYKDFNRKIFLKLDSINDLSRFNNHELIDGYNARFEGFRKEITCSPKEYGCEYQKNGPDLFI